MCLAFAEGRSSAVTHVGSAFIQVNKLYDQANQVASESFSSIRVVAAFTLEQHIMKLYRSLLAGPTKVSQKSAWTSGIGFGFGQACIFFVYALVFW